MALTRAALELSWGLNMPRSAVEGTGMAEIREVSDEEADLEAFQSPVRREGAEVLHELLGLNGMGVDEHALDVHQVSVVLQGAHVQAGLLTELGNAGAVVVGQGAVGQNGICHLRVGDQIDFQQLQSPHKRQLAGKQERLRYMLSTAWDGDGCAEEQASLHLLYNHLEGCIDAWVENGMMEKICFCLSLCGCLRHADAVTSKQALCPLPILYCTRLCPVAPDQISAGLMVL